MCWRDGPESIPNNHTNQKVIFVERHKIPPHQKGRQTRCWHPVAQDRRWCFAKRRFLRCFPRDRLFALFALAPAAALGWWAVSASGIVAAALAIALKWDLVRGFLYAVAMFLSPALRWAVGLSVFAGISAICLRAIARLGR